MSEDAIKIMLILSFLFNTAMASRNVSRRRYGWATGYALSAIYAAILSGPMVTQ